MGQISLPVVNRTGIYAHWAGSGDNVYNYSKLIKQNLFITLLLSLFFKKKFFSYYNLKQRDLTSLYPEGSSINQQPEVEDEVAYVDLAKLAVTQISLELPLYAGRVLFFKQRGVLISLVLFFQPPKGEFKRSARAVVLKKKKSTISGSIAYQQALLASNPVFFKKHSF